MTAQTETTAADLVARAERALLGACMASPDGYERVGRMISSADFYTPAYGLVWDAIAWVHTQGTADAPATPDTVLVATRLHSQGQLEQVGGAVALTDLLADAAAPTNAAWYARTVRAAARGRALTELGTRLAVAGRDAVATEQDQVIAAGVERLESLAAVADDDDTSVLEDSVAWADQVQAGRDEGSPTGLADLDELLDGGLQPGHLVVVGARPGVGKTTLGLQVALNAAGTGRPVLFFSLEMDKVRDLLPRIVGNLSSVPFRRLRKGNIDASEWGAFAAVQGTLAALPLRTVDTAEMTAAGVAARIAAFKRRHGDLGLVVIDYLQLLGVDGSHRARHEEVGAITRALKLTAKRHGVPILLLAQLSRKTEERNDKMPQLSDLRESGAIEQDADIVLLLHSPAGDDELHERAGELDIIVAKNRHGETGTAAVAALLHFARLADLARTSDGGWDRAAA